MKKIVVKLGGSSLNNLGTLQELVCLVRGYREEGHQVVVVHGGGPAINAALSARGIQWRFIEGQRQTTPEMMDVIEEVLAGDVNRIVVAALQTSQIPAVGLSGAAGATLLCSPMSAELMQVGQIDEVRTDLIEEILCASGECVPVIAPLGIGSGGEKYNINADWAAAKIAIALGAETLVFLTDQDGILDENRELVHFASPSLIHQMIADGTISGGMHTKVKTMMAALAAGLQQVRVLNASQASQLLVNDHVGTALSMNGAGLEAPIAGKDASEWIRKMM